MPNESTLLPENALTIAGFESSRLVIPCGASAPIVVNGGGFVGCSLPSGHPGHHEVKVKWERSTRPEKRGS